MHKMKHIWTVLCQNSVIDSETNNLSINNVLEQLEITTDEKSVKSDGSINVPINYEIISMWYKEDSKSAVKAEILVEIVDSNSKVLKSFTQKGEMPVAMNRLRTRMRVQGIELTVSGIYSFVTKIKIEGERDFQKVAEVPLEVHLKSIKKAASKN